MVAAARGMDVVRPAHRTPRQSGDVFGPFRVISYGIGLTVIAHKHDAVYGWIVVG